jgi:hypothetical protein
MLVMLDSYRHVRKERRVIDVDRSRYISSYRVIVGEASLKSLLAFSLVSVRTYRVTLLPQASLKRHYALHHSGKKGGGYYTHVLI